ncbi:MAG: hypothetical protein FD143_25 [Ignavibacteria bacterium]|nr:MAG: hypothetical protein FD143_25 [Ignavibacteria bacterium]KAF0158336.1 MAG: hypothetical protein FD188_2594 [Ignavibacteria bacterium]
MYILSQTPVIPTEEQSEFLLTLNRFQLEGRYPEYISNLYEICNEKFTAEILEKANGLKLWLIEKLQ